MNNRQIEIFAAIMKSGTVSRAAELLGVTQPGVSRTISELERSLGFSLFDRVRNRIIATPEGRIFYAQVGELSRHGYAARRSRTHPRS